MALKTRHITKLVTALKSGFYQKIKGKMRNQEGFDVLGVACDVYRISSGKGKWVKVPSSEDGEWRFGKSKLGIDTLLPKEVVAWYGFDDECPAVHYKGKYTLLIDLNDYLDLPFNKIGDVLEKNI